MNIKEKKELEVTVDKRHIISIGERLYTESVELLRELINNAYDADATEVRVEIDAATITVKDNGAGMDEEGLRQYFVIGSDEKVLRSVSPRLGRDRIGQFGIGKFASLAAASRFEVLTRRGDFGARVVFDKDDWESSRGTWRLPLDIFGPDPGAGDGTTVILSGLTKPFSLGDAEEKIREGVPLKAPHFAVFLNGCQVAPRSYSGQRIPILEGCRFGAVSGEVVITPKSLADPKDLGIEIRVKGATVKKDLFGMETWGKAIARIKGEVQANFLPLTSDRSNFITDSDEYREFLKVMEKLVGIIKKKLGKEADRRDDVKAGRAVKEALRRLHRALALNPDFSPFGPIPLGEEKGIGGAAAETARRKTVESEVLPESDRGERAAEAQAEKKRKRRNPLIKRITPNAIVRKIKMGEQAVSVCLDFFGENGPECFSEGNIVYINRDHPLFIRESQRSATYTMYVARLLTQEISLMKETKSPRLAFARQSKLLKDAFAESERS